MTPYQSMTELPLASFVIGILGGVLIYFLVFFAGRLLIVIRQWSIRTYRLLVSSFVSLGISLLLIIFVVSSYVLIDGPHALPNRPVLFLGLIPLPLYRIYWTLVSIPFAQIAFGLLFGAIGYKWISDLRNPLNIATEPQQIAHRRWGFVLLALMIVGTLYPSLRNLTFNTAEVKTPVADVSLTNSKSSSNPATVAIWQTGEGNKNINTLPAVRGDENRPPPQTMTLIQEFMLRDHFQYDKFFLIDHSSGTLDRRLFRDMSSLHDDYDPFVIFVAQPLVECVFAFYDTIPSQHRLRDHIVKAIESYNIALQNPTSQNISGLYKDLYKSVISITSHLRRFLSTEHLAEDEVAVTRRISTCEGAARLIKFAGDWEGEVKFGRTLPYANITFAHLLASIGSEDLGAINLARWLQSEFEGKNDSDEGQKLPEWYRVRAEYELAELLKRTNDKRSLVVATNNIIKSMEKILSEHGIKDLDNWAKTCSPEKMVDNGQPTPDARLMLTYRAKLSELAYFSVQVAGGLRIDEKIPGLIDEQVIAKSRLNANTSLKCFKTILRPPETPERIEAQFNLSYALLLLHSPAFETDSNKPERQKQLREAQVILERVIPIYRDSVREEEREIAGKSYDQRLFQPPPSAGDLDLASRELRALSPAKTPD